MKQQQQQQQQQRQPRQQQQQHSEKVPSTIKLVLGLSFIVALTTLLHSFNNNNNNNNNHHHQEQQQSSTTSSPRRESNASIASIENRHHSSRIIGHHHHDWSRSSARIIESSSSSSAAPALAASTEHAGGAGVVAVAGGKNNNPNANVNTAAPAPITSSPSLQHPTTTTTTTTAEPRLFTCGFDLWNFGLSLFGDLEQVGRFGETTTEPTSRDILLQGGLNGPCHKSPEKEFPGKVLFVHSEARTGGDAEKHASDERFFRLGPTQDAEMMPTTAPVSSQSAAAAAAAAATPRALPMVTFGAIFFVSTTTPEQQQWILDPKQRPFSSNHPPREAVVFVVNRCGTFRKRAAMEISAMLPVHQNPKCQKRNAANDANMQAIPKEDWKPRNSYRDNYKLYAKYKYCLVMENTAADNYITEKLFLAFMGGCLPIYWGSRETVYQLFNRRAFVFYDKDAPEGALLEIQHLQSNQTCYQEMMAQPILANGQESAEAYLSLAPDVGNGKLRSRIRNMLGILDDG